MPNSTTFKRHFLERKASLSTVGTEASDESHSSYSTLAEEPRRRVRFATDANGAVQCHVKTIQKVNKPSMWWQPEESARSRTKCIKFVKSQSKKGSDFCNATVEFIQDGWKTEQGRFNLMQDMTASPKYRGLEFYLAPKCGEMILEQQDSVLEAQGRLAEPDLIRLTSLSHSQGFVALALQRAQYDAKEAAKCLQACWAKDKAVLLD